MTLQEHGGFVVVAQAGTADEAVAAVEAHMPEVILLDISMPGSGLAAASEIARRFPAVAIVMLTASEADEDLLTALKAGARGYALKGVSEDELTGILQSVAGGASYVPPALAGRVLAALQDRRSATLPEVEDLTDREAEILRHVAHGQSNKEIARALDLQEKTIKHYMTNILQKLQVRNRVEAAMKARDLGLS
ncbi:two component transcriptional regulator, LuxR family [Palleronia pelagia]|uniref:Two component transcriptional regulator, LuxR family n=2 Tax=Palleronia pelagia TaxID=387096 RepID=A0A1H8D2R2_9RHOB|nr:two component transcriptional regulator, LuxR family [Palleronia pelagia]